MTRSRPTKIPEIPILSDTGAQGRFAQAVKEALDVSWGRRGDPLDRHVRVRDLVDSGIAKLAGRGGAGGFDSGDDGPGPGGDGDGGGPELIDPDHGEEDPADPGVVANLRGFAVWDGIMIIFDFVDVYNFAFAEVWASATSNYVDAVLVGTTGSNLFVHENIGLNQTRWYWVRIVTRFPTFGDFVPPTNAPGLKVSTSPDPAILLETLQDQITEAQIYEILRQRINLVDHILVDGELVPIDDAPPVQNRILAVDTRVDGAFAAVAEEASARITSDGILAGTHSVRIDLNGYVVGYGLSAVVEPGGGLGDPPSFDSAFVIRANRFALVQPSAGSTDADGAIPFVMGPVIQYDANGDPILDGNGDPVTHFTVGIEGRLAVNGSIHANTIQAGTIGAGQINAGSVWAGLVSADRVFSNRFATADAEEAPSRFRVEISGQAGDFPLWYGNGPTGGSGTVFSFDEDGNARLAGDLTVADGGNFFTEGSGGPNAARVEIGGEADDPFIMWAGSGPKQDADSNPNAKFYMTKEGEAVFNGVLRVGDDAVTTPVAAHIQSQNMTTGTAIEVLHNGIPPTGETRVDVFIAAQCILRSSGGIDLGARRAVRPEVSIFTLDGTPHIGAFLQQYSTMDYPASISINCIAKQVLPGEKRYRLILNAPVGGEVWWNRVLETHIYVDQISSRSVV